MTSARSPYHFSLHASDPKDPTAAAAGIPVIPSSVARPVPARRVHRLSDCMLGATGPPRSIFDKDRGLEILVRALDGEYLPLAGASHRLQSTAAAAHSRHLEFLKIWLRTLVRPAGGGCADAYDNNRSWSRLSTARWRSTLCTPSLASDRVSGSHRSGRDLHARLAAGASTPRRLRLGVRQCRGCGAGSVLGSTP